MHVSCWSGCETAATAGVDALCVPRFKRQLYLPAVNEPMIVIGRHPPRDEPRLGCIEVQTGECAASAASSSAVKSKETIVASILTFFIPRASLAQSRKARLAQ